MPIKFAPRFTPRRTAAVTLALAAVGSAAVVLPPGASASSRQITIIQDEGTTGPNAEATFRAYHTLGVTAVRIFVPWSRVAPAIFSTNRPQFDASNPNAYPAANWAPYDQAVRLGQKYGINIDLTVAGGAPRWAERSVPVPGGYTPDYAYYPDASEYGNFMTAIAKRYTGQFMPPGAATPLPRVHFWAIYNEPNFGQDLGPQAKGGSRVPVAPRLYRGILNAGWAALRGTGHRHDTILVGGYAARGIQGGKYPGNFGQTKPLLFIRYLYCVDTNFKPVRGHTAKAMGCPTTRAGSRRFRSRNPALFKASGVGDHPYPDNGSPVSDGRGDPNWATFPDLGHMATVLDRATGAYGSHKRFSIYNDEYGYITHPPARAHYLSPRRAAVDINWAEYLSWKNRRVASYMQYLLRDPLANRGPYAGFASGLEDPSGNKKVTYYAFNLPVYMPSTSFSHRRKVEVWGDVRPAPAEKGFGPQRVRIQFQKGGHGGYTTVTTIKITKSGGYFDLRLKFKTSGRLRLAYTYPSGDRLLSPGVAGSTIHSRSLKIKVH